MSEMKAGTHSEISSKPAPLPEKHQNGDLAANEDATICRICLSKQIDSCQAQPCLHAFCFVCLLEWSKVKRRCPLCKERLNSIVHNVRPDGDYDVYYPPGSEQTNNGNAKYGAAAASLHVLPAARGPSYLDEDGEPRPGCSYELDDERILCDRDIWSS